MSTRAKALAAAALALGVLAPAASGAAGTVSVTAATRTGDVLAVAGTSTYTDQPFVQMGTDPTGDTTAPGQDVLGADLTGAFLASRTNNQLQIRWSVASLPPELGGSPTGVAYGSSFCVDDTLCWDVDAQRMGLGALSTNPYGALWRCGDSACTPDQQTSPVDLASPVFNAATNTITASVSLSQIGASPGSKITPSSASPQGAWFVWMGDATVTVFANLADGVFFEQEEYRVAKKEVSLAVGAPGQDPASVAYATTVNPAANGSFSGGLDVTGLSGPHTVYARACFGSDNCGYGTLDVTL
ncbi:MAG TPA: hypothetical protein VGB28_08210 [Actinomycetota bacterium]|jgi:hypothetical protein